MKIINLLKTLFTNKKENELIPAEIKLTKILDISTGNLTSDFKETDYKSVREFTESEIIDFIYKQNFHNLLYRELGFDQTKDISVLREQKKPFIVDSNTKPGDLDLVLFDKENPEFAIAVEVKTVKFKTLENLSVFTNKEKGLKEGIIQVNGYLKLGFHKTYLLVILLDESWQQKKENSIFNESGLENAEKLINPNILKNLDQNVGLIYMGVRQITNQSIHINTTVDIKNIQNVIPRNQLPRITKILKEK
ncbi:MAG: hypothetical protein COB12_06750 [Flavobacterium sp.]|nr:MAG: hypothetical protein COB12_06750 [Flavobacterium sp.]